MDLTKSVHRCDLSPGARLSTWDYTRTLTLRIDALIHTINALHTCTIRTFALTPHTDTHSHLYAIYYPWTLFKALGRKTSSGSVHHFPPRYEDMYIRNHTEHTTLTHMSNICDMLYLYLVCLSDVTHHVKFTTSPILQSELAIKHLRHLVRCTRRVFSCVSKGVYELVFR